MKILSILFVFAISICKLSAQIAEADDLFAKARYASALPRYVELLKSDSGSTNLNYKIGVCYLSSRSQKNKAYTYLEKAADPSAASITHKYLGDAYQLVSQYDLAIKSYEKFKKTFPASKPKDKRFIEEVKWKIEMCKVGKKLQELNTTNEDVNSKYIEYTSALSFDQSTMTYTFHKPDSLNRPATDDGKYFEEIYIPAKTILDNDARILLDTTTNLNEATVATSVDGQIVLIYKNDKGEANLYITRLIGNSWTYPEVLNKSLNVKGWEQSEFISADGYTLYFASDRPEGFGGKDIYVSKKLPTGEWGKATNLGPAINTATDEEAPFIYSDGLTLFFSSNKNKNTCCFDIYSSTLTNDGAWSQPIKVGYPVKSNSDNTLGTMTAHQETSSSGLKAGVHDKKDLYLATFIDDKKTPFTVLKGKIEDVAGKTPKSVKITVTDNETGEILGVYGSNKTGNYTLIVPPGRNNNITFESESYLFQSVNVDAAKKSGQYEIHKAVQMAPVTIGSSIALNNIFFDFDRATMRSVSNIELNRLFQMLSADPGLVVELAYLTSAKDNIKYYQQLAQDRALTVKNYLLAKGISKDRVMVKDLKSNKGKDKPNKKNIPEAITSDKLEIKIIAFK